MPEVEKTVHYEANVHPEPVLEVLSELLGVKFKKLPFLFQSSRGGSIKVTWWDSTLETKNDA